MLVIKFLIAAFALLFLSSPSLSNPLPLKHGTIQAGGGGRSTIRSSPSAGTRSTRSSTTVSSPTASSPPATPRTPAVPGTAEIKTHLSVAPDTSLFYSASNGQPPEGSARQASEWAKKKKNGYKILARMWKDSNYQNTWQNDATLSKEFFDNASEAMAELSSGTVYVMLPPSTQADGKDWWSGSVWARKEWPALQNNPAVTKVIRIDPAGNEKTIKA
ncbi:hypothetical protein VKT23_012366 [Stygiomarasmius scandens]|uniref:Uncharacterized protein n=1 Tax=Marasmiellus scandens TaxID=2682957 RepID=A0ABR1J5Z1_9AGAR